MAARLSRNSELRSGQIPYDNIVRIEQTQELGLLIIISKIPLKISRQGLTWL